MLKEWWGDVRRMQPMAQMSHDTLLRAQKRNGEGALRSVMLLGDTKGNDNDKNALPVCLAISRIHFPPSNNATASYSVLTSGADTYFSNSALPYAPEGAQDAAVAYERDENEPAFFRSDSTAGLPMLDNGPFATRVYIPVPSEETTYPVYTLARWGQVGNEELNTPAHNRWQLQLVKGSLFLMRLKDSWTQDDEDDLHTLEATENPTTLQQTQIEDDRAALYMDYQRLDLGSGEDWYNRARTLVLIPEPRGVINIWDGAKWVQARHSDVLKTRKPGIVWAASRVEVGTNGGPLFWQLGYPQFAPAGKLYLPPMKTQYWQTVFSEALYNAIAHSGTAGKLPGTSLTYNTDVGMVWAYFVANFATTNTRYTPFLYALNAVLPAGERQGGDDESWDSADFAPCIMDSVPSNENEFAPQTYTLTILDVKGNTFQNLGANYDSGQFRVCDYYEGDKLLIENAVVRGAKVAELNTTTYNQVRSEVASGATYVTVEIASQEDMLNRWTMIEDPIGDGLDTNQYGRRLISLPGVPAAEYSDIATTGGKSCPSAVPGEAWATRPGKGTTTGSVLKEFFITEGMGRYPRHGGEFNPNWSMADYSEEVVTLYGHAAEFVSGVGNPASYPGRFAILQRLELTFELSDYFNDFLIEGADDSEGRPISKRWKLQGGITPGQAIPPKQFTGTPKLYYDKQERWRTEDDLLWARRSLMRHYGWPPRWGAFLTYYHRGLRSGMVIRVNGTKSRIVRIMSGSYRNDELQVAFREMS